MHELGVLDAAAAAELGEHVEGELVRTVADGVHGQVEPGRLLVRLVLVGDPLGPALFRAPDPVLRIGAQALLAVRIRIA